MAAMPLTFFPRKSFEQQPLGAEELEELCSEQREENRRVERILQRLQLPNDSLDVAVFSLSLMGKNWPDYIKEAKRCLATNGYLLIAETTKSLSASGRLSSLRDVIKDYGFEIYDDEQLGDFTFIEAREL